MTETRRQKKMGLSQNGNNAAFIVKIYAGGGWDIQGKIEHVASGQTADFHNVREMMLLLHDKIEDLGLPQANSSLRTWK